MFIVLFLSCYVNYCCLLVTVLRETIMYFLDMFHIQVSLDERGFF